MNNTDKDTSFVFNEVISIAGVIAPVGIALFVFLLRGVHYDERLHMHFLHMILMGLRPHQDFFCPYPASFYALFLPVRAWFLDKPSSIILLRVISVLCLSLIGIAGIHAARKLMRHAVSVAISFAALTISVPVLGIFGEARSDALVSLLATLSIIGAYISNGSSGMLLVGFCAGASIIIMPKYLVILSLTLSGVLLAEIMARRHAVRSLIFLTIGGCVALSLAQILCLSVGTDLLSDIRQSTVLNAYFYRHVAITGNRPGYAFVAPYIARYPLAAVVWILALAASLIRFIRNKRDRKWTVSLAVLLGALLSWFASRLPFPQYFVPGIMASIIPVGLFVSRVFERCRPIQRVVLIICLFSVSVLSIIIDARKGSFAYCLMEYGSLDKDLAAETFLTEMIPANERVLSVALPWTRKQSSYLMFDEVWGNPPGFEPVWSKVYPDGDMSEAFSQNHIIAALKTAYPALIDMNAENFPSRWRGGVSRYMIDNANNYVSIELFGREIAIRKSLLDSSPLRIKIR